MMIVLHEENNPQVADESLKNVAQEIRLLFKVRGKKGVQDIKRPNRIVRSEKKKVGIS